MRKKLFIILFLLVVFITNPQKGNADNTQIKRVNTNEQIQILIDYAWEKSKDIDFILTIQAESGWNPLSIGDKGMSKGLCQWHMKYQPQVRNNPNFSSPYWQIDTCFSQYTTWKKAGVLHKRLYGYNVRERYNKLFYFINDNWLGQY